MIIDEILKQSGVTIKRYLKELGENPQVFSDCMSFPSVLQNVYVYINVAGDEVIFVMLDSRPKEPAEIADEEYYDGIPPYWFTASSHHRHSPVYQIGILLHLIQNQFFRSSLPAPRILGILLTGVKIINKEDMAVVWDNLNIRVFDRMKGLKGLSLPLNYNNKIYLANGTVPVIINTNCDDTNIKEAEKLLQEKLSVLYDTSIPESSSDRCF